MKLFPIVLVAILAAGCATTSDIEESEARINAKLAEQAKAIDANRIGVELNAASNSLQTPLIDALVIKSLETDEKLDRMFEKAMVK